MSCYVFSGDTKFHITKENAKEAFNAVIASEYGDDYKDSSCADLNDIFVILSFEIKIENDNVINCEWIGNKWDDACELIFPIIAPYVEPGSYITIISENGDKWRYWFHDGQCDRLEPEEHWANEFTKSLTVREFLSYQKRDCYAVIYEKDDKQNALYKGWAKTIKGWAKSLKKNSNILNRKIHEFYSMPIVDVGYGRASVNLVIIVEKES